MIARMTMALLLSACGFGPFAGEGGGHDNLPTRGAGLYTKLEIDFETPADEPYLVADSRASVGDATGLGRDDGGLRLWFTRTEAEIIEIWRAEIPALTEWPDVPPTSALTATLDWEAGAVSRPSVVEGADGRLVMYYQGGSDAPAIGRAVSDDGISWDKDPTAVLDDAGSPAAGRFGDQWFLAYTKPGTDGIWFAASSDGLSFAEPVLVVTSRADGEEAFDRDGVSDPGLLISRNSDGTPHFGVVFTGAQPPEGDDPPLTAIGYAGSYDQTNWERSLDGEPILHPSTPAEGGPSVVMQSSRAVLLFHEERVGKLRIAAALNP